jgi:hypothetical protein
VRRARSARGFSISPKNLPTEGPGFGVIPISPDAAAVANREGKVDSQFRRLPNVASARIVVT